MDDSRKISFFYEFFQEIRLFLNVSKEEGVFGECFQESTVLS